MNKTQVFTYLEMSCNIYYFVIKFPFVCYLLKALLIFAILTVSYTCMRWFSGIIQIASIITIENYMPGMNLLLFFSEIVLAS